MDPKTRQEKGKGKGSKYKEIYTRKHVDAVVTKITVPVTNAQKGKKNGK